MQCSGEFCGRTTDPKSACANRGNMRFGNVKGIYLDIAKPRQVRRKYAANRAATDDTDSGSHKLTKVRSDFTTAIFSDYWDSRATDHIIQQTIIQLLGRSTLDLFDHLSDINSASQNCEEADIEHS